MLKFVDIYNVYGPYDNVLDGDMGSCYWVIFKTKIR